MTRIDKEQKICLVVPTIRENCIKDFIDRWNAIGLFDVVNFYLMEDHPEPTIDLYNLPDVITKRFTWLDIAKDFGKNEWIIPRRSDTVRSYAYYKAWKAGYRYIMTLDDDCYPPSLEVDGLQYVTGADFVNEHLKQLEGKTKWFNTLNSVKPRGIPFYDLGKRNDVIVNHGLWTNVIDYDAPTQLANPIEEKFSFDNRLVPHGSYFPMCGMNLMWKADFTVLMYHLLMGQAMLDNELQKLPFDRFGDIWCGIFLKKIADLMNKSVATGMPYIRHERASNPFTNLKKEANGLEVNEVFWMHVDMFNCDQDTTVENCYYLLGEHIKNFKNFPEYNDYFQKLGEAMLVWSARFS